MQHGELKTRIYASEKRLEKVEKGLIWIFALLIANLGSVVTMLIIQLNIKTVHAVTAELFKKFFSFLA